MFDRIDLEILEYPAILGMLADLTRTPAARESALSLMPMDDADAVTRALAQTASARTVFEAMGDAPIHSLKGLDTLEDKLRLGEALTAAELIAVGSFLNHCRLLRGYLKRALTIDPLVPSMGMSVEPLDDVRHEIERCFRGEALDDRASPRLHAVRMDMERTAARVKEKLSGMLRVHPEWYQESFYSMRGRRYVLPVRRDCQKMVRGAAMDLSASGQTVFVEPEAVSALTTELDRLEIDESNEEIRILAELSAMVASAQGQIKINRESMETLDFIFARGRLASGMKCGAVTVAKALSLSLESARHPLLGDAAVPMSLALGGRTRAVVITGPNTGGKTVSIKTAGLLCAMALSGLEIPAERATIPLLSGIYADIGDGQSVSQNLSTFSAHMKRVVRILNLAGPRALVLLDEVGSGTDPQEGMGLAVAILRELGRARCLLMATSHYPELKRFAATTEGFLNARMTFDRATLTPTYHLEPGEAGESCALDIARRLGMPLRLLDEARDAAYPDGAHPVPSMPAPEALKPEPEPAPEALTEPEESAAPEKPKEPVFQPGDRVRVPFMNCFATVVLPPNARGELLVRVRDKNVLVNQKRVQVFLDKEALYPGADYDLDIVLDSWENRKKRKQIDKGKAGVAVDARPENSGS
jgi:dsDNA-specific endonuclease/ATPase MutS2